MKMYAPGLVVTNSDGLKTLTHEFPLRVGDTVRELFVTIGFRIKSIGEDFENDPSSAIDEACWRLTHAAVYFGLPQHYAKQGKLWLLSREGIEQAIERGLACTASIIEFEEVSVSCRIAMDFDHYIADLHLKSPSP